VERWAGTFSPRSTTTSRPRDSSCELN
jgi:hypothetical protein